MVAGGIAKGDNLGRAQEYKGRTTLAVLGICLVASSGGLIFGYDIGITGGVTTMKPFQEKFFPEVANAPAGSQFCKYNNHLLQLFTSSLFLAGGVAALLASWTSKKFGRKFTMTWAGLSFILGSALCAGAVGTPMLVIGRLVLGVGVGFSTQATPLFLSEMAPYNLRGALNILFQLAVTIGIVAAQLINYGAKDLSYGWRLSLGLGAVPAALLFVGSLFLPDTPNSLVERGCIAEGKAVLQRVRGVEDVAVEFEDISEAVRMSKSLGNPYKLILGRKYRPQLVITIMLPLFQQFTGINAIMFYSGPLFESIGSGNSAALLNTVIIGAVNVAATFVAIYVVDRFGRRVLFLQGGTQMFIAEIVVGALIAHYLGAGQSLIPKAGSDAIIAMICIYVAGFAWSWGPLGWLVPSEIQPLEIRTAGTAIATVSNFLWSFIIGQCFLSMLCAMEWGVFLFFAGFVAIMTLFVLFFVPETAGVPIEELSDVRIGQHWFWKKVVGDAATMDIEGRVSSAIYNPALVGDASLAGDKQVATKVQL